MRHQPEPGAATPDAVTAEAHTRFTDPLLTEQGRLARQVVGMLGGRYSAELGIDVDAGDAEIERWFLAATLFGTRRVRRRGNRPCPGAGGPYRSVPGIRSGRHADQGSSYRFTAA